MFGAPLSARDRASKVAELGLREAVREALPTELADQMARQSRLIDAQTALGNVRGGPSAIDALGNGPTSLLIKLLRANAVRGAVGAHALSETIQRSVPPGILRGVLAILGRENGEPPR